MTYRPGSHLIATLKVKDAGMITRMEAFRNWLQPRITAHQLQQLGDVWHNFSPNGFTGVVCLSESHLSIHTWPDHLLVNLDIYLSNYERTNDGTVQLLFEELRHYLDADIVQVQTIVR